MIKDILKKYIGQMLILVTIVGLILFAYSKYRDSKEDRKFSELIGTQTKYEQLTKYTAKLKSDYQSQKNLLNKAKEEFAEVVLKKNERIKVLSDATYLIGKHVEKQDGPDYYFSTKKGTRNYLLNEIRLQGKGSPAIGYIMIKKDGRTYKRNYAYEINVKSLHTVDEKSGHIKVVTKAFLVKKETSPLKKRVDNYDSWFNKPYPLDIVGGTALIDPTVSNLRSSFHWYAPHINGGINFSGDDYRASVDVSISGYGKSINDLKYKLFHLGVNFGPTKDMGYHFMPFSYRLFDKYITNTYIGPGVAKTRNGTEYYINLNLGF